MIAWEIGKRESFVNRRSLRKKNSKEMLKKQEVREKRGDQELDICANNSLTGWERALLESHKNQHGHLANDRVVQHFYAWVCISSMRRSIVRFWCETQLSCHLMSRKVYSLFFFTVFRSMKMKWLDWIMLGCNVWPVFPSLDNNKRGKMRKDDRTHII